jgi:hypothetical protein
MKRRSGLNAVLSMVVLCGAATADAKTIPVQMYAGNITVGCSRTSYDANYDLVDFYLTGMTGAAAGLATDGSQTRINIMEGRWTAGATGAFWLPSSLSTMKSHTVNTYWETPTYSTINFDSSVSGVTAWTNSVGGCGRGPQTSGNLYNYFSGSWYTTDHSADIVYGQGGPNPYGSGPYWGPNPDYSGAGTNSTYLAALYVTKATPDAGIGYGNFPGASSASGKMDFSYGGGRVENVAFATVPEPSALVLLAAGGAMAALVRRRRRR